VTPQPPGKAPPLDLLRLLLAATVGWGAACHPSVPREAEPPPLPAPEPSPAPDEPAAVEADVAGAPAPVPVVALPSPLRPDDIASAIREHGLAAMPVVWAALNLPSPLASADDETKRTFSTQVARGEPCRPDVPCVTVVDGRTSAARLPFVLLGVSLLDDRETLYQILAFEMDGGRARFAGHLERASFRYAAVPAVRIERVGGAPFIVLSIVHHPGSGSSVRTEEWSYLDARGGSFEPSLDYVAEGAEIHGKGLHDQTVEGKVAWTGQRGRPAVDVQVTHAYVNTFRLGAAPSSWVPFFEQKGRLSFLFDVRSRRFELDAARSTLTKDQARLQFDAASIVRTAAPWLMRLASGTGEARSALVELLDECARQPTCASTDAARRLGAVAAPSRTAP
jgi:hypothetical protein